MSDEHRKKISEGNKGKIISEETKQKISKTISEQAKEKWTDELKAKCCISQQKANLTRKVGGAVLWKAQGLVHWQFKPIVKYDYEGNIIAVFNRPEEVIGRRSTISNCCRGSLIPTDGYVYRRLYPNEHDLPNTLESILKTVEDIKMKPILTKEKMRLSAIARGNNKTKNKVLV